MSFERTTPCGVISGTACQWPGVAAYKGIRYATAGRWEFPVPVTHWDGVYDATQYGACCYQPRAFYDEAAAPGKAFYYNEFRKGETYTYSEDCLFLNIWAPADAAPGDRLPVIFYIHGGGFTGGCGHEKHFDGPVWPTKGCVAVTINYRLGPMGFVCLPELADEAGSTGNYALLDQLAALQWVRPNIAAFGGDANNITIMGQSAGAMSVQQLVLSPITRGLFSKAVMSSGGGVSQMLTAKPAAAHYPFWKQVMEAAGYAVFTHTGSYGVYFALFGFAAIFLFSSYNMLPTAHNNNSAIMKRADQADAAMAEYVKHYPNGSFPVPSCYAHPIVLKRMIDAVEEGQAVTTAEALDAVKARLQAVNADVQVEQEEYDEIVAIKALFLNHDYQ